MSLQVCGDCAKAHDIEVYTIPVMIPETCSICGEKPGEWIRVGGFDEDKPPEKLHELALQNGLKTWMKAQTVHTSRPLTYDPNQRVINDPRGQKKKQAARVLSDVLKEYFGELQQRMVIEVARSVEGDETRLEEE